MKDKPHIFYFFPLASIGGTESVHADIMKALSAYQQTTLIRYESNVWKGKAFAQSKKGKEEGRAMLSVFEKYSEVIFVSRFLEANRFGRIIRKWFIQHLARKINKKNAIIIFWHRESIEFILPHLNENVKLVDIVHNNSNNEKADPQYLLNDLVPKINVRVLVTNGLLKWIKPLYISSNYPDEFYTRIRTVEHAVYVPESLPDKTNETLQILFVGRDTIEKRIELIYETAKICFHKNLDVNFNIIGPAELPKSKELPNINFIGTVTNREIINQYYSNADILLLTSSTEGFPKVIAEAMAHGCITISTNVGGISTHIQDHHNGLLTDVDDCVNHNIELIIKLIQNPNLRQILSSNAYLYALKKFGFAKFNQKWGKIIDELS